MLFKYIHVIFLYIWASELTVKNDHFYSMENISDWDENARALQRVLENTSKISSLSQKQCDIKKKSTKIKFSILMTMDKESVLVFMQF